MEDELSLKERLSPLSASKAKTLESCSWLYWVTYHLKLPRIQNDGAKKGDICHKIFELLLTPKHIKKYETIVRGKSVRKVKSIEKLIKLYAKQLDLKLTPEIIQQLDEMIMVGLTNDFFGNSGKLVSPEYQFEILNENPTYYFRGFMDKPFIKGNQIVIDDFKSSKKKFEGDDQESNLQALFYSLAAKKIWPALKPIIRFIFLQYPKDPMMEVKFTDEALKGFEYYLAKIQKKVNSFCETDARANYAADQEPPGKEFKGKLLCGFASRPGQLKKDGSKMWHCPYKFPLDYWAVKKDGLVLYSTFEPTKVVLKEGETLVKMHYEGCPKFRNVLNSFNKESTPKKTVNVLDDF